IHAKAWLAQQLIDAAWQRNRAALAQAAGTTPSDPIAMARPWAWADTTPVARLEFPALGRSLIVLAGESGRTLAFGPGHRPGTPWPAHDGNAVVSGHRDTHFALLRRLQVGDAIDAESIGGRRLRYRVVQLLVTDKHAVHLTADRGQTELTLVTCWPFDAAAAGGPGRYVVRAVRADR
ncbi:MAG TPA: class GN sortase, partial [Burkholderiaceae bacterium]|nr:class GN sortase [Burkholderiaceae bacterium]